jgi:hypothetical protein
VQEVIESDEHIHCFVFGREYCRAIRYSLEEARYLPDDDFLNSDVVAAMKDDALAICQVYGYDMNMVEFVVKDGTPYVINPTNPAPDMDINLLKPDHFAWCVQKMADSVIMAAKEPPADISHWEWRAAVQDTG